MQYVECLTCGALLREEEGIYDLFGEGPYCEECADRSHNTPDLDYEETDDA